MGASAITPSVAPLAACAPIPLATPAALISPALRRAASSLSASLPASLPKLERPSVNLSAKYPMGAVPPAVKAALVNSSSSGFCFSLAWRIKKLPNCWIPYVATPAIAPPTGVRNGDTAAPTAIGVAIWGALWRTCSTIYFGACAAAAAKPWSAAMRSKSATVIPGFSCGFSFLASAMTLRTSSVCPVICLPASPKPVPISLNDSIPRPRAAGIASKKPISSGAFCEVTGALVLGRMSFWIALTISSCDIVSGKFTAPTLGMFTVGII